MIAVITGSSGFIGSHLVDALLARAATVRVLLRATSDRPRDPRIECHTVDLLDARSVRSAAIWTGATHVFHLGGVTKRRTLAQFRGGNVVPTANLVAAARAHTSTIRRFVFVSSQAAAGPASDPSRPITEDDEPRPIESYGRSKLEAEEIVRAHSHDVPVTIVRPGAVYGPRDVDFLNVFREARRRLAFHAAPRTQVLSIVYVRDLIEALLLAAEQDEAAGRTYFAAHDTPATWHDIYGSIARISGTSSVELQLPSPALTLAGQAGDLLSLLTGRHYLMNGNKIALSRPRWWLCDSSRAHRELGWHARTALSDGLRETCDWYLDAGWLRAPRSAAAGSATRREHAL